MRAMTKNESALGVTFLPFWRHLDQIRLNEGDTSGLEMCFFWQEKNESLASGSFLLVLDSMEGKE